MKLQTGLAGVLVCATAATSLAAPRDVQIRSVNFATGILELHNYGLSTESLTGWRFCSHDEDQVRRYSSGTGLNGRSLAPGATLFLHFNNDAPADPAHLNVSSLGGSFATPFDGGPAYAISIYFFPVSFGNGNTIADHLQWSAGGIDNATADERSDEAVTGGVWGSETDWISTAASTTYIRLTDLSGAVLHTSADYTAFDAMPDCNNNGIDDFFDVADGTLCPADFDCNGLLNTADFVAYLNAFTAGDPVVDIAPPFGTINTADFLAYLNLFTAGC